MVLILILVFLVLVQHLLLVQRAIALLHDLAEGAVAGWPVVLDVLVLEALVSA